VAVVATSCRREAEIPASSRTSSTDYSYKCSQIIAIDPATAWPVPADAEQTSTGVFTKQVRAGTGRKPETGTDEVLLLCATYYDRYGKVVEHDPMLVHDIDLPPKEWQEIISRMREGEIRRFWISPRRHINDYVIGDFELQPILTDKPVAPAAPSSRSARNSLGSAIATTVCVIAAAPSQFYGKRVTVEGCITTDGIERTVLNDKTCPYSGIGPAEGPRLAPAQRFFPEVDQEVCGTFTGVFHATTSIAGTTMETNVLEIDEIANLKTFAKSGS